MTLTTLLSTARFYLWGITTSEYSDANLTAALNRYYHKAIARAIMANGQWEVNGDVATTDIVAGQQEYVLTTPIPLLALKRIEVNLTWGTNDWTVPDVIDMRTIPVPLSNTGYFEINKALQIRIYDNSLFLLNAPTKNVTGGLKIYYQYEADELSTGTDEPNLVEEVQTYLLNGACYDYCVAFDLTEKANRFYNAMQTDLLEIDRIYSNRLPAVRPKLTTLNEQYQ